MNQRLCRAVALCCIAALVATPTAAVGHDNVETPTEPEPTVPDDTPTPPPTPTEPDPTPPDTPTEPEATVPDTPTVPSPTVPDTPDVSTPSIGTTTLTGAAFPVPPSLEDEAARARQAAPSGTPNAFVLADQSSNRLVFVVTDTDPVAGEATATGRLAQTEIKTNGLTFGVLIAEDVDYSTAGTELSLSALNTDAQSHRHDLVTVSATHRRVSVLTDPDGGAETTAVQSVGRLSAGSENPFINTPGKRARSPLGKTARDDAGTLRASIADRVGSGVATVNMHTRYWYAAPDTVTGIVLTPDSAASRFLDTYTPPTVANTATNTSTLYVTDTAFDATEYDSVGTLTQGATPGDVVSVRATVAMQQISVQETLEATSSCKGNLVLVPTPAGAACLKVTNDVRIDAGVAIDTPAKSERDALPIVGLSANHLDDATATAAGEYHLTGTVVAASQIDDDLPDEPVLVIHRADRQSPLDYATLIEEQGGVVANRTTMLRDRLRDQITVDASTPVSDTPTATETATSTTTATTEPTSTAEPSQSPAEQVTNTVKNAIDGAIDTLSGLL
jgi:hypothetical protein